MGNLGGAEVLVILLVALIVLGPTKLPEAARQVGKAVNEVRRISGGFQREMREALQEPFAEEKARDRGRNLTADQRAARAAGKNPYADPDETKPDETKPDETELDETKPDEAETETETDETPAACADEPDANDESA